MINSKFNAKFFSISAVLVLILSIVSFGQNKEVRSKVVYNQEQKPMNVAERNNVYCAGYITNTPINSSFGVVGADDEQEQNVYAQGDYVYLNQGANNGVKVGDMFSVVRPQGKVKARSKGKGNLGFYVKELGAVEVVRVRSNVSVARVKTSCDNFLLGDLVQPMEVRVAPLSTPRPALDVFAEPNGKRTGKIVMARDGREALGKEQIVYVDLGAEDNVSVGDYLTIFHPLGKGGVLNYKADETAEATNSSYGSQAYKGTDFSILTPRKSGNNADGSIVTSNKARKGRPADLRKVVGEAIVLKVNERTATVLITRSKQEVHPGDSVEIQ